MEDKQTTPQASTTFADVKLPNSSNTNPVIVGSVAPPQPPASPSFAQPPASIPIQVNDMNPGASLAQPTQHLLPAKKGGGGGNMIAIVIAVLVFLVLAGAVVYVYLQSNTSKITRKESTTTTSDSVAPATAKDVDDTIKIIDDNLANIDADIDFTTTDLSDATLGL